MHREVGACNRGSRQRGSSGESVNLEGGKHEADSRYQKPTQASWLKL